MMQRFDAVISGYRVGAVYVVAEMLT